MYTHTYRLVGIGPEDKQLTSKIGFNFTFCN